MNKINANSLILFILFIPSNCLYSMILLMAYSKIPRAPAA